MNLRKRDLVIHIIYLNLPCIIIFLNHPIIIIYIISAESCQLRANGQNKEGKLAVARRGNEYVIGNYPHV